LKFRNDPDPGEARSKQICTLPITIQGLPKDCAEVSMWHDDSMCDGTSTCECKRKTPVTKALVPVITQLDVAEADALQRFNQLCVWGRVAMMREIRQSKFILITYNGMAPGSKFASHV
jgi:hypothetical protein